MSSTEATREGFRRIAERPLALLAEVGWRWTWGAAVLLLLYMSGLEFLRSFPVSDRDLLVLRSHDPWLISLGLQHIFQGTSQKLLKIGAVLVPATLLWWVLTSSLGRAATVYMLRRDDKPRSASPFDAVFPTLAHHFMRAMATLAAAIAVFGTARLAALAVVSGGEVNLSVFYVAWFLLLLIVGLIWSVLNWYFTIAPVFASLRRQGTWDSLGAALSFTGEHRRDLIKVSVQFALFKAADILIFGVLSVMPFLVPNPDPRPLVTALAGILLLYFVSAEWLHLARISTYVAMAEHPGVQPPAETTPAVLSTAN